MLKEYIDFYDNSIPMGKRKLQYIKHLSHNKGFTLRYAINTANKIFGFKEDGYYTEPKWIKQDTEEGNEDDAILYCQYCGEVAEDNLGMNGYVDCYRCGLVQL